MNNISVQPEWMKELPFQQQSVLFLASRGPDAVEKYHTCKEIQRAYRACVFIAAKHGKRMLEFGEDGDSFMSLRRFSTIMWNEDIENFLSHIDSLPLHYVTHIMHGAEILAYKHPDERFKRKWLEFYIAICNYMHVTPETPLDMDMRLKD